MTSDFYTFRQSNFITSNSLKVRKKIYDVFYERFSHAQTIADVGVTSEGISPEANVLESLFPDKNRITAIGIEDAGFLEDRYPGMKFVRVQPNEPLPFGDNSFDVVHSHAVIEHVVDPAQRLFFLKELFRIGKNVVVTTPNKYFPLETHTFVPMIHYMWPKLFYFLLDKKIPNGFYNRNNLKLLSKRELKELGAQLPGSSYEIEEVRFMGTVSNLILIVKKEFPPVQNA